MGGSTEQDNSANSKLSSWVCTKDVKISVFDFNIHHKAFGKSIWKHTEHPGTIVSAWHLNQIPTKMLQISNYPYHSQQWQSTVSNLVCFFKDENKTTNEPQKAEANNKAEPKPKQQGQ